MGRLFTFGETMIKLAPLGHTRLEVANQVHFSIGGAESNVAVALARLGQHVTWFSRLPENPLGNMVLGQLRQHGVDVSTVQQISGERIGTYYVEFGATPRSTRVWYDRQNSAASKMTPDDLPLDVIAASDWLHLTGITPALSETCRETVATAITHAREHHVRMTFDVNYRALLWSAEQAAQVLNPFCEAADFVFIAGRDASNLFSTSNNAQFAVQELQSRWGGTIIVSHGERGIYGCAGDKVEFVPAFACNVVDRFGAGDAMAAGILYQLMETAPLEDALRFGAAVAALLLTIPGDMAIVSHEEVEDLIQRKGGELRR